MPLLEFVKTEPKKSKGEGFMILYSRQDCPLCTVAKTKLNLAGIEYEVCFNLEDLEALGIDTLPVLKTDDNQLLSFKEIIEFTKEEA